MVWIFGKATDGGMQSKNVILNKDFFRWSAKYCFMLPSKYSL